MYLPDLTTMTSLPEHLNPEPDISVLLTNNPKSERSDTFPQINFAILLLDRERLHLYLRPELGRVRYIGTILSPQHLLDQVSMIPEPSVLVLAGNRLADRISVMILPHRDLYIVPDAWLSHITDRDATCRARTAARIVHAHLIDPIQLRLSPIDDDVPF
jgi:hypothetical protein